MKILLLTPNTPGLAMWPLISYLQANEFDFTHITHPVAPVPQKRYSAITRQRHTRRIRREPHLSLPSYFGDLAATEFLLPRKESYDYAICITPHLALYALGLRKRGHVGKVLYWALDYYPKRYGAGSSLGGGLIGNVLEKIYKGMERRVVAEADVLWTITNNMSEGWAEGDYHWKAPIRRVPHTLLKRHEPLAWKDRKNSYIWSGTSREGSGLDLLVASWPRIAERMKERTQLVLTARTKFPSGYEEFLNRADVDFRGFIPEMEELEALVSQQLGGLATFDPATYKKYSDASRAKLYLSLGIPTIISGAEELGREIQEAEAGLYVNYKLSDLVITMTETLTDREINERLSWGAYKLAGKYLPENVFGEELAFLENLNH